MQVKLIFRLTFIPGLALTSFEQLVQECDDIEVYDILIVSKWTGFNRNIKEKRNIGHYFSLPT